jgi:hypothetical protein
MRGPVVPAIYIPEKKEQTEDPVGRPKQPGMTGHSIETVSILVMHLASQQSIPPRTFLRGGKGPLNRCQSFWRNGRVGEDPETAKAKCGIAAIGARGLELEAKRSEKELRGKIVKRVVIDLFQNQGQQDEIQIAVTGGCPWSGQETPVQYPFKQEIPPSGRLQEDELAIKRLISRKT